ncbi:hypothetical protein CLOBOL_03640 [Enterocloster bolteae ATCC BAA-613]|uniref:Uncharacterized protein n=1 Tax=Enterocloster bolteae (strain ATCC BAA-613 / DSM 15670 / CCUG 46953 / JCM 12243 / WAL 16351) TaxID=411902 RepID=A8RTE1_ENTBW|nr:hypothetical protein CLOBOL_03640 [Enterocloster bolteae ATCC BAA-613]
MRTGSRVLQVPVYHDWMHRNAGNQAPFFAARAGFSSALRSRLSPAAYSGGRCLMPARGRGKNEDKGLFSGKCQRTCIDGLERANIYNMDQSYSERTGEIR